MRSSESIACSLTYIQRAPDLTLEQKSRLAEFVRVLNIEVTTVAHSTQPVTYVVDFSLSATNMDTVATLWLAQMPQSGVA